MREGGKILAQILDELLNIVKIGATGKEIENIANNLSKKYRVKPAFLNFNGYPFSTCISINSTVVHGFPNDEKFKTGDYSK